MAIAQRRVLQAISLALLSLSLVLLMFYSAPHFLRPFLHNRSFIPTDTISDIQYTLPDDWDFSKMAFATLVTDVSMVNAALVSIYSLIEKAGTRANVVVMLSNDVEQTAHFTKMGASILRVPLRSFENREGLYSALQDLSNYEKVIYFSPNVLFKKNVDRLFGYPAHSAARNDDDPFPNLLFMERYDAETHTFDNGHPRRSHPPSMIDVGNEEVHIFSGPMKPWDYHRYHNTDWHKFYDPIGFYQWHKAHDSLRDKLEIDADWVNKDRRQVVCDAYIHPPLLISDQFSVLLSTYNPERIDHVALLIRHLLKSSKVHTVFVTWHNPKLDVPQELADIDPERVRILRQVYDSLNNRFNPVNEIVTEAVYIVDDDIFIDIDDLEFTFQAWRANKDSIVGHFPRIHKYNPKTGNIEYKIAKREYSLVLTKSMFVRTEFLFSYTCLMDSSLHRTVDDMLNCEDIAFSLMSSGLTASSATAVLPSKPITDYGLSKGISTNNQHMNSRSMCLQNFINQYWAGRDPLLTVETAVVPYNRPTTRRGHWEDIKSEYSRHYG